MNIVRTVPAVRTALIASRRTGLRIGLVPTMGALHAGHLALIQRARAECQTVVVSLFVNPTQFNEDSDLDAYPRDEARDAELAVAAGADLLFAPGVEAVYPAGFATTVSVAGITESLEGTHRGRGHFDGVTTVVTKLLNMVGPDVAYFGQKDAQQALVVTRLVHDLDIPTQIRVVETVREPDGLALSSRNVHLSAAERQRARALPRALEQAALRVAAGERDTAAICAEALAALTAAGAVPEYFTIADPTDLRPLERVEGPALALVAARVGHTRLIDNRLLTDLPDPSLPADHPVATLFGDAVA